MMLRRIGILTGLVALAVFALWIAALRFLPDAPAQAGAVKLEAAPAMSLPEPRSDLSRDGAERAGLLHVPVRGVSRSALGDSWGDPRGGGSREHHGIDIPAAAGTLVEAAAPGQVEKLFQSQAGGTTVYVRSPDRRWTYYYAHLAGYVPGLAEGQQVRVGMPLGYVGDTGNAGAGNYHLHFGLTRTTPDQHWSQGQDVDPFPYLVGRTPPR